MPENIPVTPRDIWKKLNEDAQTVVQIMAGDREFRSFDDLQHAAEEGTPVGDLRGALQQLADLGVLEKDEEGRMRLREEFDQFVDETDLFEEGLLGERGER